VTHIGRQKRMFNPSLIAADKTPIPKRKKFTNLMSPLVMMRFSTGHLREDDIDDQDIDHYQCDW